MTAATRIRGPWAMPDARILLPADAPREEWLAERRKGIGGSDASTVVGVNPYSSRYELWLDKTGQLGEREQTDAMRMGRLLEPVLRQIFVEDTGIKVRSVGLVQSKTRPWQMVSLDGLTEDGGIFESKTTNWRLASEWEDEQVSDHAEVQVQHGLAVTGRSHAWVIALIDGRDPQIRKVDRDQALIDTITEAERAFWFDHVKTGRVPALEANALPIIKDRYSLVGSATTVGDPAQIEPLIATWKLAKVAVKEATRVADEHEAQLRLALGDAEAMHVLGEARLTLKANGTFSQHRFTDAHPDLAEQLQIMRPALDMDRLKSDYPIHYATYRARVLREVTPKKAGK